MSAMRFGWTALACLAWAVAGCGGSDSSGSSGTGVTGGTGVVTGGMGAATGGTGVATGGTGVATGGTGVGTGGTTVVGTGGVGGMAGTAGMAGMTGTGGTSSTAPDLQMCLDRGMMMGENADCTMCVCTMCFDQADNVYNNPDPAFSMKAKALIDCARTTCCKGQECYCGKDAMTGMVNLIACLATPMGPCKNEIEAAAGAMGALGVMAPCTATMTTNACGAALAFGECVQGNSEAMPPITGKCPMCTMCM